MVGNYQRYRLWVEYSDILREMERNTPEIRPRIRMQIAGDLVGYVDCAHAHGMVGQWKTTIR